jgi:hypothetical protein
MMSDRPGEQGPGPSWWSGPRTDGAVPLVLELVIAGTDPMHGTVGQQGEGAAIAFRGWIDLMSAINSLRTQPPRPAESAG